MVQLACIIDSWMESVDLEVDHFYAFAIRRIWRSRLAVKEDRQNCAQTFNALWLLEEFEQSSHMVSEKFCTFLTGLSIMQIVIEIYLGLSLFDGKNWRFDFHSYLLPSGGWLYENNFLMHILWHWIPEPSSFFKFSDKV